MGCACWGIGSFLCKKTKKTSTMMNFGQKDLDTEYQDRTGDLGFIRPTL